MNDERYADGLETATGEIGPALGRRGRQLVAEDMRETDAGFLENGAVTHYTTQPAATTGTLPRVATKLRPAVQVFDFADDPALQGLQVAFDLFEFFHALRDRTALLVIRSRISEGPDAGPQSPGTM